MLSLSAAIGYGTVGGLITEAIVMLRWLEAWRQARHAALTSRRKRPAVTRYIDPVADLAVAVSRAGLGAVAGWLLHGELTGVYAAVMVGASAPAVLATLGKATTPADAFAGGQADGPASAREASQPAEVHQKVVQ
jgi:hypothetical protein